VKGLLNLLIGTVILHSSHIAITTATCNSTEDHDDSFSHVEQIECYVHGKCWIWVWQHNEANIGINNYGSEDTEDHVGDDSAFRHFFGGEVSDEARDEDEQVDDDASRDVHTIALTIAGILDWYSYYDKHKIQTNQRQHSDRQASNRFLALFDSIMMICL